MLALASFTGYIAIPMNNNSVHWSLLLISPDGSVWHLDSLGKSASQRCGVVAQLVRSVAHFNSSELVVTVY